MTSKTSKTPKTAAAPAAPVPAAQDADVPAEQVARPATFESVGLTDPSGTEHITKAELSILGDGSYEVWAIVKGLPIKMGLGHPPESMLDVVSVDLPRMLLNAADDILSAGEDLPPVPSKIFNLQTALNLPQVPEGAAFLHTVADQPNAIAAFKDEDRNTRLVVVVDGQHYKSAPIEVAS